MSVNLLHLRAFYAVASDQSVTRAANRLGVSQPTLSKQVKALEDRYQVKLIRGARPPLELTPEGEALFERARVIFDTAERIEQTLGQAPADDGGLLRVGADSPPFAAKLVSAYLAAYPAMDFKVQIANARDTNTLLMKGLVDIAIVCEPIGHNEYSYVPFYTDRLVAVTPLASEHVAAGQFRLDRIPDQLMLLREPPSRTRAMSLKVLADCQIELGRTMEFHTREMIREAIGHGVGMTLMLEREVGPDVRIARLPIVPEPRSAHVTGYLAARTERRRRPAIRRAFDIAAQLAAEIAAQPVEA